MTQDLIARATRAKEDCLWESARDLLLEAADMLAVLQADEPDAELQQEQAGQLNSLLLEYVRIEE